MTEGEKKAKDEELKLKEREIVLRGSRVRIVCTYIAAAFIFASGGGLTLGG